MSQLATEPSFLSLSSTNPLFVTDAVFPAAGFLSLAITAAAQVYQESPEPPQITGFSLRNVSIKSTLRIPEDDHGIEIVSSMELTNISTEWSSFLVSSVVRDSYEWTEHCTGLIKVEINRHDEIAKIDTNMDARVVNVQT